MFHPETKRNNFNENWRKQKKITFGRKMRENLPKWGMKRPYIGCVPGWHPEESLHFQLLSSDSSHRWFRNLHLRDAWWTLHSGFLLILSRIFLLNVFLITDFFRSLPNRSLSFPSCSNRAIVRKTRDSFVVKQFWIDRAETPRRSNSMIDLQLMEFN